MPRPHTPGRRRAPGTVRRLPDGFRRIGAAYAVKTVAGIAVVGGAATMLALPSDADPSSLPLASPAATALDGRQAAAALAASRSSRGQEQPAPAVSAPAGATPVVPDPVGVSGVRAVAKPKPTPKPTPTKTAEPKEDEPEETRSSEESSSDDSSSSRESSSSSSSRSSSSESSESSSSEPSRATVSSGGISGRCGSIGLNNDAARLCTAVQREFGISNIGGYRPSAGEHSTGQAVDFMTSSRSLGDAIADFVIANAAAYDVEYLIWRQRYRPIPGSWEFMEDRGSATANHYDHVHVTVR